MDEFLKILPLLVPIILVEIILLVIALLDLLRRQQTRGPKWAWFLIIFFIQLIGPILYLVLGKEEE
jgi:hypothetical protein